MKVTLLGTGTSGGVPLIGCSCPVCRSTDPRDQRLRSSALLTAEDGKHVAIDCGPDFRQQMLRAGVGDLEAIVFTHEHKDHTAGLDDVRAINFVQKKPVALYATASVFKAIKSQYEYIFTENTYPGLPQVTLQEIDGEQPFEVAGMTFLPIPVMHYRLPVLGFRIKDFAYVTDANEILPLGMERLQGLKVLVLNALRRETHISHFTLNEALEMAAALQPEQTWLTHISHQMGLHHLVDPELPRGVSLGFDGVDCYI
ncbi:MAG: MBL fold metallo-hydrolase [Bacteroidetes bacterium]|nr:MBL fold metallo-hydrolase [Bacteroidota bacterium]